MPFKRILVAIDGSEGSERAFLKALELARLAGAELEALAIEGPLPAYAATVGEIEEVKLEKDAFFERLAERAREQALGEGIEIVVEVRAGHAAEVIVHRAAQGFDLVVVGHKSRLLQDFLLGSTADRVAHHAPCPVMIVK